MILVRYNADGTLDTSFGRAAGITWTPIGDVAFGNAVAQQPDGKLVVAGETGQSAPPSWRIVVARYLDASVGGVRRPHRGAPRPRSPQRGRRVGRRSTRASPTWPPTPPGSASPDVSKGAAGRSRPAGGTGRRAVAADPSVAVRPSAASSGRPASAPTQGTCAISARAPASRGAAVSHATPSDGERAPRRAALSGQGHEER